MRRPIICLTNILNIVKNENTEKQSTKKVLDTFNIQNLKDTRIIKILTTRIGKIQRALIKNIEFNLNSMVPNVESQNNLQMDKSTRSVSNEVWNLSQQNPHVVKETNKSDSNRNASLLATPKKWL